jgi:hypothetical protein
METFDSFWKLYPRKVQKIHARKSYTKALKNASADEILMGLKAQLASGEWRDKQYIPYPATWLSRGGWEVDQPAVERDPVVYSDEVHEDIVLAYTDSHPAWVDAVNRLRDTGEVSAYDIMHWFYPTHAIMVDGTLKVGCLDPVNAEWMAEQFSDKIDAAITVPWEAVVYSDDMASAPVEL